MEDNMQKWSDDVLRKKQTENKIKNLISALILISGMFLGSLFIDLSQMLQKSGFSGKKLNQSDIFEANGKTWVAYGEPAVGVKVISDETCKECKVDEILVWMRRILPTVATEKVEYTSDEGKQLIEKFGIKTLPAFVFGAEIKSTDFYAEAGTLFDEKDGELAMRTGDIGIPVGKYVELPKINDGDATFGAIDAKVKVVVFSDFQCPYCKLFHTALRSAMKNYADNVAFDYKFFPLSIHAEANDAALAAGCALDQGKFWEYADKLYGDQANWANKNDLAKFKEYARTLGLNATQFNQCLDDKKYQTKIDKDTKEADGFGISGTPGVFVNDQFQTGAISVDQLKSAIDGELAK
ncbi:MAG: thioredoxin domain-containing protein [Candidatus Moraniibacteriota bacterium]